MFGMIGEAHLETLEVIQAVSSLGSVAGAVLICWIMTTARMKDKTADTENRKEFQSFLTSMTKNMEESSRRTIDALITHREAVNTCKLMQERTIKALEKVMR